jgi:type VI secretion system protein VasG
LEERWARERDLVEKIREARRLARDPGRNGEGSREMREQLDRLATELHEIQGENPLLHVYVDGQTVANVVSGWTGIPVGRMMAKEIQTVLGLSQLLRERVVGQDQALEAISRRVQTSRANLDDPRKPVGVFLLVGSSGVGKTETAIALSELLYGGERNLITINMSEYQEAHTVSGLKGSPPGYVGYGEGGVMTEAVRRKPYSVLLLDEVEKAHPDVMELFFQVFDKGTLEDGEGRQIDFKNTIILLTSNVATDTIVRLTADPDTRPESEALAKAIRPELEKVFPPALLGRLVVCPYYPLPTEILRSIVRLKLNKIVRRVQENQALTLTYDDATVDLVVGRCTETASGARAVDNLLTNTLLPDLSKELLSRWAAGAPVRTAAVGVASGGGFTYNFS